jgi:ABC-type lipoprotein export system ATPase subunit/GNAT superfamily N-acetyltransferase
MVLVIGVLGAWGKGKTLTLTMLQELAKTNYRFIGLSEPCIIVSNYMTKFADYFIAINPPTQEVFNPYTQKPIRVLNLETFLSNPPEKDKNYFLFLDDVYSWLASWYFSSNFNNMALRLLASGRKKNINIALSSTRWKDIDPRLRANHTHLIFPTYIPEKKLCKIEINLIGVHDLIPLKTLYFNAKRYFNAYDTREIIEPVYPTVQKTKVKEAVKTIIKTNGTTETIVENRKPDGYDALAKGVLIQQQIADEYRKQGYTVECNFGHDQPDIILYEDENKTKPIKVISVKSYYLVPSNQRWTATPLPSGEVVWKSGFANARTVYRKDVLPELSYAINYGIECELIVVNLRNGRRWSIRLDKDFEKVTTPAWLSKDRAEEEEVEKEEEKENKSKGVVVERVGSRVFRVNVSRAFDFSSSLSERVVKVGEAFGVGVDEDKTFQVYNNFVFELSVGDVVYVTGDSGSGKSLLLRVLKEELAKISDFGRVVDFRDVEVKDEDILVESVGRDFDEAVKILSFVGLNDAFLFLRKFGELSDGQKYRFKLAKLLSSGDTLIVDEFCSLLDRDTAKVIAYLYQKICRQMGKTLVVATAHTDLFYDLNPDVYIRKKFGADVEYKRFQPNLNQKCSLLDEIVVEEGTRDDYVKLESFHYRANIPPFIRAVYKAVLGDEVVGVIVYATVYPNLKARNVVLPMYGGKTDKEKMEAINRDFERIARVIVLPKYRGIGIAQKLVKETMPLRNKPYIESLAVMGRYNPFFEKAGMLKVDVGIDESWNRIFREIEELGFDLNLISSKSYNVSVIESLDEVRFERLKQLLLKHFITPKFRKNLEDEILNNNVDAMAEALKNKPLNTVYFIWKNPAFKDYPDPIIPSEKLEVEYDEGN